MHHYTCNILSLPDASHLNLFAAQTYIYKLLNWGFMNFSETVCVKTTTLGNLKKSLEKRHGKMLDLKIVLCKTEIVNQDETTTLKDIGISGELSRENAPVVSLYYDFKPSDGKNRQGKDPVLISW